MAAGWSAKDYTPFFLFNEPVHTEQEIRTEYSRLRDIGVKRAARLRKQGLTAQADYLEEIFPTLANMEKLISSVVEENKTLPAKKQKKVPSVGDFLRRGKSFLDDSAYSLKGIRELQKLINEETGEIVPIGEVLEFDEYMKSWRLSAFSKTIVTSEQAAEWHKGEYNEFGGSFSDFYTLYKSM